MYKVIIADDENKTCQLIQMLGNWEKFGIEVVAVCTDGEEAYHAILTHKPDIVITDIRMPIYDGLQLIEKTKNNGLDTAFIIISGYRHFEYAQNALRFGIVDYLLKPIDQQQLNEVLEKTCLQLDKKRINKQINDQARQIVRNESRRKQLQFLKDILDGKFTDNTVFLSEEELKRKYELEMSSEGVFQALLLNVENQELLEEGSLFVEKTEKLFSSAFQFCHYAITGTGARGIWCAIYFDRKNQMKVNEAIQNFYYNVRMMEEIYGNFRPVVGVGTPETEKECFIDSFKHAGSAEWQKMAYPNMKIHYYKVMPQIEIYSADEMLEQMKILSTAMELLQIDTVHEWFEMIQKVAVGSAESLVNVYEIRQKIIDVFHECLKKFQVENAAYVSEQLENRSFRCGNLKTLWNCLEMAIREFLQEKNEEKIKGDGRPIQIVKQYVENHLNESITLEDAAAVAGFAPTYFSGVFKKQTGQTFTEYLTEVRIQEAKRLLRCGDKSIGEIAVLTGYPDDKYFRKLFKKIVGIKASEYRKLYL
ncbi:MAG: response regulator [Lachnospiraceae bacterium]|nr:response regulator [Lachnospiraceae bacterium]